MISIQQSALSAQPNGIYRKGRKERKGRAIGNWQLAFVSSFYAFV
jgi:hypothetical protein